MSQKPKGRHTDGEVIDHRELKYQKAKPESMGTHSGQVSEDLRRKVVLA